MSKEQKEMVKESEPELLDLVPPHFKLFWKSLKFQMRLGSGSFGDCYKGTFDDLPVAIKRMRVALTDKKGFEAFCKEILTLSNVSHPNVVNFVGFVLDPCLLIVMGFVSGGTLSAFVEMQDPLDPPTLETSMKILIGSAKGLEYLHAREPMPILHRDVKSENILLTDKLEPCIADLGEARAMAKDHAMTIVSCEMAQCGAL